MPRQCMAEFMKWSLKQRRSTSKKMDSRSPPFNVETLLRRLYGLARHSNPYKRLGACLTFLRIYRQFREEESLVSIHTLEMLHTMLACLRIADADDPSLGTADHARNVINRLARTITDRANGQFVQVVLVCCLILRMTYAGYSRALLADDRRRSDDASCRNLMSFVGWLFQNVLARETAFRRTVMLLFRDLAPLTLGAADEAQRASAALWVARHVHGGVAAEARGPGAEAGALLASLAADGSRVVLQLDGNAPRHLALEEWFASIDSALDCSGWMLNEGFFGMLLPQLPLVPLMMYISVVWC